MPLRSPKMKRFILGFQRRVWCPKWTPASSSCFMVTTATRAPFPRFAVPAGADAGPGAPPRGGTTAGWPGCRCVWCGQAVAWPAGEPSGRAGQPAMRVLDAAHDPSVPRTPIWSSIELIPAPKAWSARAVTNDVHAVGRRRGPGPAPAWCGDPRGAGRGRWGPPAGPPSPGSPSNRGSRHRHHHVAPSSHRDRRHADGDGVLGELGDHVGRLAQLGCAGRVVIEPEQRLGKIQEEIPDREQPDAVARRWRGPPRRGASRWWRRARVARARRDRAGARAR